MLNGAAAYGWEKKCRTFLPLGAEMLLIVVKMLFLEAEVLLLPASGRYSRPNGVL